MGKVVAVVGRTGAGKSTLIDILMGLLEPTEGDFYYDGSLIGPENIAGYRGKIGYVPQNFFLADDSIRANIAFGIPQGDIDNDRIENAVRTAQLETFIKDLPDGLDTLIGEKGTRISGGQRQRIGLARALYREPEILVLDESTSALDKHTEEEFYVALRKQEKRMSVILVTHRLSTLEHADLIFVMEDGKVAAQGNFRELSESSPVFQKMTNQKLITETKE
jgi:ATP-binding cassette subfamily C protein